LSCAAVWWFRVSTPPAGDLAGRTVRGVLWNYGSFALSKAVVLVATAVLARLLAPEEFGIVAVATVAVVFLTVLQDLGLGPALIQRRGDIEKASNVVFTLNLLLGVSLTAIVYLIAPFVADYFREPTATPLLRVLGLTFAVESLGAVHLVRLQRELRFRRVFIPDVGRSVVKGAVSIGLAVGGMGAWSLIYGQLAGVIVGVLLSWVVFPWRPSFDIDSKLAKQLINFGLPLFGVEFMWVLFVNLDYVIIGRQLGTESLGIYTLAYRLPELLVLGLMTVVNRVAFPAFSAMQEEEKGLRRGFLAAIHYVAMISLPLSVGLAIAADPIVRMMLGPEWLEAIPVLRVLAIFVLIASLINADGDVYKAVGRPDILLKLAVFHLAMLVPALLIGVQFGLVGVAVGHLTASVISRAVRTIVISRFLGVPIGSIARQWRSPVIGGAVLAVMAGTAMYLTAGMAEIVILAATVIAGAIGYTVVLWRLERDEIVRVFRLAFSGNTDVSS
jgi:O-antigen/teichoic acid export membrane protein